MRNRDRPLEPDDELSDGGVNYVVERVGPAPNAMSFGHAWVRRIESSRSRPRRMDGRV
jgi:hypothetical protein